METYYAYLRWCRDFNERNLIDPTSDKMEWNHTLPKHFFGDTSIGDWLTLKQHSIATALQSLAWNRNLLCYWHVQYLPGWLWEICRPLYSEWCADHATGFTPEQRAKGLETQKQNQLGFYNPDFHVFEDKSAAGQVGGSVTYEKGVGLFSMDAEEKFEARSAGGKVGGKSGLNSDPDYVRERGKKAGSKVANTRARCTKTGFESNISGLTRYQVRRGIDPSNRVILN